MLQTILISAVAFLFLICLLALVLVLVRIMFLVSKITPYLETVAMSSHPLVRREVSSFLDNLQDAIEDGEETEDYSEIEVNPGKFRVLHGRLKGICRRLDNFSKGYLLSSLVHSGLSNNPFILEELDLSGASCPEEQFIGADLSRLVARGINFRNSVLSEARLEGARINYACFAGSRLDEAKLQGAYLNEADLQNCYLKGTDLQRAYLMGAFLQFSRLEEANLEGAILREANLDKTKISGCNMFAANLSEASLVKSVIKDTNLQGATLSETNLQGAYLGDSDLDSADLWKANLSKAIMLGTNFQNSYLNEAKFFGPYKDLLDCKEVDLEKFQEKGLSGLYCSSHDDRFGVAKATNFNKCQWWKAEFDKESAKTLWKYLAENFAAPNGLELSEEEWEGYKEAEKRIQQILVGKHPAKKESSKK
jgi:uncharacterized protein YjbI with pentapeptide repeats